MKCCPLQVSNIVAQSQSDSTSTVSSLTSPLSPDRKGFAAVLDPQMTCPEAHVPFFAALCTLMIAYNFQDNKSLQSGCSDQLGACPQPISVSHLSPQRWQSCDPQQGTRTGACYDWPAHASPSDALRNINEMCPATPRPSLGTNVFNEDVAISTPDFAWGGKKTSQFGTITLFQSAAVHRRQAPQGRIV